MNENRQESICDRCGGPNPIAWHAPSPLWNAVMRSAEDGGEEFGFCCPTCFVVLATERGFDSAHWHLGIHGRDFAGEDSADGRVWDPRSCLWAARGTLRTALAEAREIVKIASRTRNARKAHANRAAREARGYSTACARRRHGKCISATCSCECGHAIMAAGAVAEREKGR